jgi:hypothetical protein
MAIKMDIGTKKSSLGKAAFLFVPWVNLKGVVLF